MVAMPIRTRRLHWINALLTIIRLRKTGGFVGKDALAALKITLHPPSPPAAASPDLLDRIRSSMLEEDEPEFRKERHADTRERTQSPISTGMRNCRLLLHEYEGISDGGNFGGYYVAEKHYLTTPPMKRRGRPYRVQLVTGFTIQYARGLPYRTSVISQPRHPGDLRLSGLEVLSLLLLAMECYENAPNEPFQMVRLFAVDSFSVRRLSASIPSTYICTLLQLTKNAAPNELVGHIAIEQTPYFDLSNDHELECILAALLEDEFRRAKQPELEPYLVSDWF